MAAIDELLARIEDRALRADLEREIQPLRGDQSLGLVFERHMPESVRLYGHPVRRGLTVQLRSDPGSPSWRVLGLRDGFARIARRDANGDEIRETQPVHALVVMRRFGESIYPGLRSLGRIERGGDRPFHSVIKAENHHALEALSYAYEDRVDAIFIDPPYNTGARDWKYNNDYVNRDDRYRHSKWLAMMERRLKVAQSMLRRQKSVLIVSIDENELPRLTLLLEKIFRGCKIQTVTALTNPAGAHIIDQFSRVDEQLLFVHVGSARPARTVADTTPGTSRIRDAAGNQKPFSWPSFLRSGGNSRRRDTKSKFFPVYIDETRRKIVGCGDHLALGIDRAKADPPPHGCVSQWPIKRDGTEACWQLSDKTFRDYLAAGRIKLGERRGDRWGIGFLGRGAMRDIENGELTVEGTDDAGSLIVRNAEDTDRSTVGKTVWTNPAYSAREHGSRLLPEFIPGRAFPFPKSLYMVEDALRFYVGDNPNAIVLDFFAGSGTTAHAVLRLNHQDGGSRTSISVTNNEVSEEESEALSQQGYVPGDAEWERQGIYEHVTRPRIEAAVTGTRADGVSIESDYRFVDEFPMSQGFDENIEFFELTYEDKDDLSLGPAFDAIAPLIWLKAGGRGAPIQAGAGNPWAVSEMGRYGIIFDTNSWHGLVGEIRKTPGRLDLIFVITESDEVFQTIAAELPVGVEPVKLMQSFFDTFESRSGAGR